MMSSLFHTNIPSMESTNWFELGGSEEGHNSFPTGAAVLIKDDQLISSSSTGQSAGEEVCVEDISFSFSNSGWCSVGDNSEVGLGNGGSNEEEDADDFISGSLMELEYGNGFDILRSDNLLIEEDGGDGGVGMKSSEECGGSGNVSASVSSPSSPSSASVEGAVKLLECSDCSKTFTNPLTLQVHMRLHTGERPYKCKICGEGFIHYTYLEFHNSNTHGEADSTSNSKTKPTLKRKRSQEGYVKIEMCNVTEVKSDDSETFVCPYCQQGFGLASQLISHMKSHKEEKDKMNSTKSERTKPDLQKTKTKAPAPVVEPPKVVYKNASRLYPCQTCGKEFKRSDALKVHTRIHTGSKPFRCTVCDLTFRQQSHAHKHLSISHSIDKDQKAHIMYEEEPKLEMPAPKAITNENEQEEGYDILACALQLSGCDTDSQPHSDKTDTSSIEELNTESNHSEPVTSSEQASPDDEKGSLDCETCGKRFTRRAYLLEHIRSHTGERPYACTICGLKFSRHGVFWEHKRKHEFDDGKPYKCDTCGKKFSRNVYLTQHVRTHTGEKPYECSQCGDKFARRDSLQKHTKKTHRNSSK